MTDRSHHDMEQLPVWELRHRLASAMAERGRAVLTAPTGSGKSTAVPCLLDALTENGGEIWVLEPRRLAARMLAHRVASLCRCPVGDRVGFQTRYETQAGKTTRIRFMTSGILPRALLRNPQLTGVSAVVFDEFHERSIDTDIGLSLVRDLAETGRKDLRLLVMSATLDTDRLCDYLEAPVLEAEGRLHPVDIAYRAPRRDERIWDAAAKAVSELLRDTAEGDVLVFMPGAFEIGRTVRTLEPVRRRFGIEVLPLHGSMSPAAQNRVMEPGSARRVVVATNIAETSLTMPGVRHVVDSGLVRTARYDAGRGVNMLVCEAVCGHSAEQRAGRAGRLGPGRCIRLWNLQTQYAKPARIEPEIQRADLAPTVLQLHGFGHADVAAFPWLDAPNPATVDEAERVLRDLRALDVRNRLTDLGERLLNVPAHPRVARFLIEADRRACGLPAALAAAALTERTFMPTDRQQWQRLEKRFGRTEGVASDLLVAVGILDALRRKQVDPRELASLGVNPGAAKEALRAASHLAGYLRRGSGAETPRRKTVDAVGDDLIRCMAAAFPDHLACRRDRGTLICELRNGRNAELARCSTARGGTVLVAGHLRETGGSGASATTVLSMVSVVPEEWLEELFGDGFREVSETVWDSRRLEARSELQVSCMGVVLERESVSGGDPEAESRLLADYVWRNRESLRHWNDDLRRWLDRVHWLAGAVPEKSLLTYEDEDLRLIVEEFCAGERRFAAVRNKPLLPFVRNAMTWNDQQFVEAMAPERIRLPCGRRMRIDYDPARRPRGRARIQDLYGVMETPAVAGGRERLLIEIQAPNFRAVQITDDLAAFWRDLYPKVKQQLARRYPKHEWR